MEEDNDDDDLTNGTSFWGVRGGRTEHKMYVFDLVYKLCPNISHSNMNSAGCVVDAHNRSSYKYPLFLLGCNET